MIRSVFIILHAAVRGGLLAALVLASIAVAQGAGELPKYALVVGEPQAIRGSFAMHVETPRMQARQWVFIAAIPPLLAGQPVVDAKFSPHGQLCDESGPRKRSFFRAVVPVRGGELRDKATIRIDYQASLCSRRLVEREPRKTYHPPELLTKEERTAELAATELFDFKSDDFQQWRTDHQLDRRAGEQDVDLARRAFLAVTKQFQYEYKDKMDRRASHVCEVGRSDCGGLSVLFASLLRSQGIPARVLAGRIAESATPAGSSSKASRKPTEVANYQQHIKAEFYLDQVGWVPADCSSAVLADKSANELGFFGYDSGDFLTLHIDPEVSVDALKFGKHQLVWLQAPAYWVSGIGTTEGATTRETWQVEHPHGDTP